MKGIGRRQHSFVHDGLHADEEAASTALDEANFAEVGMESGIPLLVGVTGYRRLQEHQVPALRDAIVAVLSSLQGAYPHTPLMLMSPLAAGSDQLVVETALNAGKHSTIQVAAVLPWPQHVDLGTTAEADERGHCDRLLSRAAQVVELPLLEGVTAEDLKTDPQARDRQYDQAGRYIARHCQILIAVWDGNADANSHTARVVRYHAEGAPAPFTARTGVLDTPEQAAVCRIWPGSAQSSVVSPQWTWPVFQEEPSTGRSTRSGLQNAGWLLRALLVGTHHLWRSPSRRSRRAPGEHLLKQRWAAIERFNQDVQTLTGRPRFHTNLQASCDYLVDESAAERLPADLQRLRRFYGMADTIASHWQGRTWRTVRLLFLSGLLAVISLETYAHLFAETYGLALYLTFLACGYGLFRWTERIGHQGRWLDARALAEGMRVQVFWRWAQLGDCVADHYLRHFRGELDWIRHALRAINLVSGGHVALLTPLDHKRGRFEQIRQHWIADQNRFFSRSAPDNAELETAYETAARIAFAVAVLTAGIQLWQHAAHHHMSHALVLTTFGFLVIVAFLEEYADVRAYSILARRYRWMAALFATAETRFSELVEKEESASSIRQLVFELGCEALAENADWVIQHRERPPVLPAA